MIAEHYETGTCEPAPLEVCQPREVAIREKQGPDRGALGDARACTERWMSWWRALPWWRKWWW